MNILLLILLILIISNLSILLWFFVIYKKFIKKFDFNSFSKWKDFWGSSSLSIFSSFDDNVNEKKL